MANEKSPRTDKSYFVTVSRQFGSMGRQIAKEIANELGIDYYDRDILEKASRDMGRPISELSRYDEVSYSRMQFPLGRGNRREQDHLFNIQQCFITEMALSGKPCLFVGRCADFALRHEKNVFNIFIYAPIEERIKNCVTELGMNEEEAAKMIKSVDQARENYHRFYTGESESTIKNRAILMDSSLFGIEKTAQILATMIKDKLSLESGEQASVD